MLFNSIVVVDDNEGVRVSLKYLLKKMFDKIITLDKPDTLLQVLDTENVNVVLLDMNFSLGLNTGHRPDAGLWRHRACRARSAQRCCRLRSEAVGQHEVTRNASRSHRTTARGASTGRDRRGAYTYRHRQVRGQYEACCRTARRESSDNLQQTNTEITIQSCITKTFTTQR